MKQIEIIAIVYGIWVAASAVAYAFILPDEWKWVCYGPLVFVALAIAITAVIIIMRPILPKPIPFVHVGRQRVTACQFCPMLETRENPVNIKFPILKCRETAKICYHPMKIPGWCPYAD